MTDLFYSAILLAWVCLGMYLYYYVYVGKRIKDMEVVVFKNQESIKQFISYVKADQELDQHQNEAIVKLEKKQQKIGKLYKGVMHEIELIASTLEKHNKILELLHNVTEEHERNIVSATSAKFIKRKAIRKIRRRRQTILKSAAKSLCPDQRYWI